MQFHLKSRVIANCVCVSRKKTPRVNLLLMFPLLLSSPPIVIITHRPIVDANKLFNRLFFIYNFAPLLLVFTLLVSVKKVHQQYPMSDAIFVPLSLSLSLPSVPSLSKYHPMK